MARTATCVWCRVVFVVPHTKGPVPKHCSAAHRQRAYEDRHDLGMRWYCDFHGRIAGEFTATHKAEFCWYEYKRECNIIAIAIREVPRS